MNVLVLGGGYAGLLVTRKLERRLPDDVSLTIVDETGDHLVQHELHRVIRRPELTDDVNIPLTELLDRADVVEARVTGIDRERRSVTLDAGESPNHEVGDTLSYDVVAVCLGAQTAFYDVPGLREHATPLKRLDHAAEIRRQFLEVVERGGGTVTVGGAGLSGVQVAGELAAFAREEGVGDTTRVVLLERESTVVPGFPEQFREAVRNRLDTVGVDVHTESAVTGVTEETIGLAGEGPEELPFDQFVWAGGIRGSDALDGDRPQVRGNLRLDDHTFVVGDAARIVDADGERVPASAQAAVRAADTAAHNVAEVVRSRTTGEFADVEQWAFESPGWLVSVGDDAVAQIGSEVFTGSLANLIKSGVGVTYLAEHGSLRRALGVLRDEVGDDVDLARLLRDRL